MKSFARVSVAAFAFLSVSCVAPLLGQPASVKPDMNGPIGPVGSNLFHTTFVKTGSNNAYGLLYEPETLGRNARVAIVYASPKALFDFSPAAEMASRGYQVLLVKHYLADRRRVRETSTDGLVEASRGIAYMRGLPGVERVVLMGQDVGGRMAAFYEAAAEQGTAVCQRPELIYPCTKEHRSEVAGLAKPDGVILLDPALGAFDTASAIDPAYKGNFRSKSDLDMYAARNGFTAESGGPQYSGAFIKRFYAAQSARNMQIIDDASARLKLVDQGKADFIDDEPFVVAGAFNSGNTANLYDADLALLASTRAPHTLLKADGSTARVIVHSVRSPAGPHNVPMVAECCHVVGTTVRRFLDNDAVRTMSDFAVTADSVVGVDWKSSLTSAPSNAESITVSSLVLTMTCSRFVVPGEIVFDHLAAKDKNYVAIEGAGHNFAPCKSEYGDTRKRTFDFVDHWLAERGRF